MSIIVPWKLNIDGWNGTIIILQKDERTNMDGALRVVVCIVVFVWLVVMVTAMIEFFYEIIEKKKCLNAMKETIYDKNFELSKCVDSIKNNYEVYDSYHVFYVRRPIIDVCQDLAIDIRNGHGMDSRRYKSKDLYADRLNQVIEQLKNEEDFNDEKAMEIVSELKGKIDNISLENIRRKLTFLEAYHQGIVSVKDAEIKKIRSEMIRKKWISIVTGVLGVVGSVASIISYFESKF